MLIEFTVKNYGSFKNETSLSLETGAHLRKFKDTNIYTKVGVSAIKNAIIFGPNGSGKSQLLDALNVFASMVRTGGTKEITDNLPYNPFLFDPESKKAPTTFSVDFIRNDQRYYYEVQYNRDEIIFEKLSLISGSGKEKEYFVREKTGLKSEKLDELLPKLRPNALFLFLAQRENDPVAVEVYRWFMMDLINAFGNGLLAIKLDDFLEDLNIKNQLLRFLYSVDINIVDYRVQKIGIEDKNGTIRNELHVLTSHYVYDKDSKRLGQDFLDLTLESEGTQRIFWLGLMVLYAQTMGQDKTIIMDEFDNSYHEELAKAIVEVINSKPNKNQFIFTTHNVSLMDINLRSDQIYLISKDRYGISSLRSIFDFNDSKNIGRGDIKYAKRYIEGCFGAVPIIDSNDMIEVLKIEDDHEGDD